MKDNELLEIYREGYKIIIDDLKSNIDYVYGLISDKTTSKVTIEIVIKAGNVPTYTIQSEHLPKALLPNEVEE